MDCIPARVSGETPDRQIDILLRADSTINDIERRLSMERKSNM